jgi:hypothetical protein
VAAWSVEQANWLTEAANDNSATHDREARGFSVMDAGRVYFVPVVPELPLSLLLSETAAPTMATPPTMAAPVAAVMPVVVVAAAAVVAPVAPAPVVPAAAGSLPCAKEAETNELSTNVTIAFFIVVFPFETLSNHTCCGARTLIMHSASQSFKWYGHV